MAQDRRPTGLASPAILTAILVALLSGCSSPHASGSAAAAPSSHSSTANPAPSSAPASKPQPLAVITTNRTRQGDTYDVVILSDGSGRIVARTTAHLPSLKLNSDLDLPLVSVSGTRAYYLDGDTTVRSFGPDGTSAAVTTISAGATSNVTFSVSPDDTRIAVGVINQQDDDTKTTGITYVEDLRGGGHRVQLFTFTGTDAYRWPVGWENGNLVVALRANLGCGGYATGNGGGGGGGGGTGGGGFGGTAGGGPVSLGYNCAGAYHVVDATTGSHVADVCQTPANIFGGPQDVIPVGQLTAHGVACLDYGNGYGIATWNGQRSVFAHLNNERSFACGLSLDGSMMACSGVSGPAVSPAVLIKSDGTTISLGRRYAILGWMDSDCMLVSVDRDRLGIVAASASGMHLTIAFANADQVSMVGTLAAL